MFLFRLPFVTLDYRTRKKWTAFIHPIVVPCNIKHRSPVQLCSSPNIILPWIMELFHMKEFTCGQLLPLCDHVTWHALHDNWPERTHRSTHHAFCVFMLMHKQTCVPLWYAGSVYNGILKRILLWCAELTKHEGYCIHQVDWYNDNKNSLLIYIHTTRQRM